MRILQTSDASPTGRRGTTRAAPADRHALLDLQQSAGNRAVGLALGAEAVPAAPTILRAPTPSPAKTTDPPGAAPAGKTDVTSDISLDSPDFWTHLMTRTMVAYGRWLSDTRQAINQFTTDMGTTESAAVNWLNVFQAWIGALGTAGDITNALITSTKALHEVLADSPNGLSLAAMTDRENRAIQALSDKTADVKSDLPIYAQLRAARAAEPQDAGARTTARAAAAAELNGALAKLPPPERLRQQLAVAWVKRGVASYDWTNMTGSIALFIKCAVVIDDDHVKELRVDSMKAGIASGTERDAHGIENESGALTALKGAFGEGKPLSELPLNVGLNARVDMWAPGWGPGGPVGMGSATLIWARRGQTWVPVVERNDRPGSGPGDPFGSELGYETFQKLRVESANLTVKDLEPFRDARAWW